jgi:Domain of unknown function (DUF1788)
VSKVDRLLHRYDDMITLRWSATDAGSQRVWFVVYDKDDERHLRVRLPEFATATTKARHKWIPVDLTDAFARWMETQDYREEYFAAPEKLAMKLPRFHAWLVDQVRADLASPDAADGVVALYGVAALFGLTKVSTLVNDLALHVRGRMVVFFPGSREENNFHLLDARDGWNYHALPITAQDEGDAA